MLVLAALGSVAVVGLIQKRAADESVRLKARSAAYQLRHAIEAEGQALALQAKNVAQASVVRAVVSAPELDPDTIADALGAEMHEYGVSSYRVTVGSNIVAQAPTPRLSDALFRDAGPHTHLALAERVVYLVTTTPIELRPGHTAQLSIAQRFAPVANLASGAASAWVFEQGRERAGQSRGALAEPIPAHGVPACSAVGGLPRVLPLPTVLACNVGYRDLVVGRGRLVVMFSLEQESSRLLGVVLGSAALLAAGIVLALTLLRRILPRWAIERHRFIEEQKEKAQVAARAKSEFLAMMSHEIRTPLNGILGVIDLLHRTALSAKQQRYTHTIERSSRALLAIINDILDLSRLEAHKLARQEQPCEPQQIAQDVAELLALRAHEKGLELVCQVDAQVPPSVICDGDRLKQVLMNLLGNAIKFADSGHVLLKVERTADRGERLELRFSVIDTGIGIAAEDQSRLFELFSQLDGSLTRRQGGTGLGLAICKKLVEAMDGTIGVQSARGAGSTFWFTLPVGRGQPTDAAAPPSLAARDARVLVAASSPALRDSLVAQLEGFGLRVDSSDSASAAKAALQDPALAYGAVIVDGALRDAEPLTDACIGEGVPALLLVSSVQGGPEPEPGVPRVCLTKPVSPRELCNVLRRALDGEPLQDENERGASAPQVAVAPRGRVLVVDDNEVNRIVAVELVHELGWAAEVARSGSEAVERARAHHFDLILMDCQMPGMDGYEASRSIRALSGAAAAVPIVALTAHTSTEERAQALASGMNDCVEKPIRAATLAQVLARWVPGRVSSIPAPAALSCPPPASAQSVLDPDQRRSARLVDVFLREAPAQLSALTQAADCRDPVRVRKAAHTLKGSCLALGAPQLAAACRVVESSAVRGQVDQRAIAQMPAQLALVQRLLTPDSLTDGK